MVKSKSYMQEALKEARCALREGEVPVGAVIAYKGKIIARGYNQVEKLKDPTAHAEMIAITKASYFLKSKFLHGCNIFVTIEPCSMCAGALILSRIDAVFYAADDPKTGALGSKLDINSLKLNHKLKVKAGVLEEEARRIMQEFFKGRRSKV